MVRRNIVDKEIYLKDSESTLPPSASTSAATVAPACRRAGIGWHRRVRQMNRSKMMADQRPALLRPATMLTVASIAIAVIVGLLPGRQRLKVLTEQREPDGLSHACLQFLLRTHPNDTALHWTLAQNFMASGRWDEARNALESILSHEGAEGRQARLAALEIDFSKTAALAKNSSVRERLHAAIVEQIESLSAEGAEPQTMGRMAQISLAVGHPELAATLHRKLAVIDSDRRQTWLELAAGAYLASGVPEAAARAYHEAALVDQPDVSRRRSCTLLALDAYLAANQGERALSLAQAAAPEFGRDPEYMRRVVAITLQQNDIGRAQHMGRQLLAQAPEDTAILAQQVDVELAAKDFKAALSLARRLHLLEPGNYEKRRLLAQIAESAEQPALALEHWAWLAHRDPSSESMQHALRLAAKRKEDLLWLDLAARLVALRPLKPAELAVVGAIHLRGRQHKQLYGFLQGYVRRYPGQREVWEALTTLQDELGNAAGFTAAFAPPPRVVGLGSEARNVALS